MIRINVVFVLLYIYKGDGLFSDDISDILVVVLWISFPTSLLPRSLHFPCSREYSVSQQYMCLPGCTLETTCVL